MCWKVVTPFFFLFLKIKVYMLHIIYDMLILVIKVIILFIFWIKNDIFILCLYYPLPHCIVFINLQRVIAYLILKMNIKPLIF